ncbi:transglycosylase domain-containing protein [Demequina litorisediminis]|uniref:Penicillin-binding protein 1A n=1 Tax=Demequina litorisediminis TaxID=1849022 RepID=A0ABQ6IFM7_9MICO|nr:transglycosylase domain-containing protein [Demequina litorisediminis]GMA35957.1 hypothetical protein GCM10025876_21610 [Demequina litorisediminis]
MSRLPPSTTSRSRPRRLTAVEAATIAGITQNPTKWDPTRTFEDGETNYEAAEKRRDTVLGTMYEEGMITKAEFDEWEKIPVEDTLNVSKPLVSCAASDIAPFFCDYVTKVIAKDEVFNSDGLNGTDLLYKGGLDIVTTLDVDKQKIATEEPVRDRSRGRRQRLRDGDGGARPRDGRDSVDDAEPYVRSGGRG